ncbi:MAG: HMG-CoA synthase [Treponemataceae bacterium]|nr:HMG-CoA synthase [Treponemataceae bacterium]
MNEQMNKYNSYMQKTYSPIDVNTLPYFVNMKAMREYAKEKGVSISSLTDSEKEKFIKTNPSSKEAANL